MKRIGSLDVLKYIACFIVINIHMDLPKSIEVVAQPFLTVAVPIFFMITGFFYTQTYDTGKVKKQIKKVAFLAVVANLVHLGFQAFKYIVNGDSLYGLSSKVLEPNAIINLIIFNQPVWRTSLWYINALLYVLVIVFLFQKISIKLDKLNLVIPALLICNLLIGTYSTVFSEETLLLCYSRNFLFCGLPYFLIGNYIYHNKTRLCEGFGKIIYAFLSLIVAYGELSILKYAGLLRYTDHLISTPFLAVSLFCLFIKNKDKFKSKVWTTVAEWGRKYAFLIYILHSIIIEIFYQILPKVGSLVPGLQCIFEYTGPIIVLVASTLLSIAINSIKGKLK